MLTLLRTGAPQDSGRLNIAAAHLQHAMAHLNAVARDQAPADRAEGDGPLEELRLIVYALNDLLIDVTTLNRQLPATDGLAGAATEQKCSAVASIRNESPMAARLRTASSA